MFPFFRHCAAGALAAALVTPAVSLSAAPADTLPTLTRLAADPHPRVRAEAVRALAAIPSVESITAVLGVVDTLKSSAGQGVDPYLDYAVWLSINDLARPFLAALDAGTWAPDSPAKQKQLEYALKAIEPGLASGFLARKLAGGPLPADGSGPWIELVGDAGGPGELEKLYAQAASSGFSAAATTRVLGALNTAARLRNARPAGTDPARLQAFLQSDNPDQVREACRLAGAWKQRGPVADRVFAVGTASGQRRDVQLAAFEALREIGGPAVITALTPVARTGTDPATRFRAAATLFALQPDVFGKDALAALGGLGSEAEALAGWNELLKGRGSAKVLSVAVSKAAPSPLAVKTGLRAAREGGRQDPDLVAALTLASGAATADTDWTADKLKAKATLALSQGDPARGERIYRRVELGCVGCHSIGGAGGKVGPDMTSIGASAPADYLVESLFAPNAKIKEGYHSILVETKDDQEFSGILVRESGQELVLRNSANQEQVIPKNNIRARRNGLSLMPAGLLDALPAGEQHDLIRFLSVLGKPGDYDAAKGGVARVWRIVPLMHTDLQSGTERFEKGEFPANRVVPIFSLVDGRLTSADIEANAKAGPWSTLMTVFAATQLSVPADGAVTLRLDGGKFDAWIDGRPLKPGADGVVSAPLTAGNHQLVVRLDAKALPPHVRVRSGEVNFVN